MKRNTLLRHSISLLFLTIFIFDAQFSTAQTTYSGVVIDEQTGESLPAANIQIEGTFQGTITNSDGVFTLNVNDLPAVFIIRYIGYETRLVEVTEATSKSIEIGLTPTIYQLDELVITDQDLAVSIMRKVIEKKQQWRESLQGYEAEAYTRFTLENDTGIVSIIESVTDVYWQQKKGMREIVKAQRKTSNMELDEFLPAAQFMANLYDDNIEMVGYTFIGVTHPDALKHYIFELIGYRYIDEQLVYDISVTPRNKFKTGFSGQVSVLDDDYALIEVQLEPGEAFLFPPPINGFDVVFEQQFSSFGGAFWLPVDFRSQMDLEVGFGRLISFPTIHVEQVSRMADYSVNVTLPDSLFEKENSVVVDSIAVSDSLALEKSGLAVPLNKAEVAAYETIDSTMTLEKAYQPKGALATFIDTDEETSDNSKGSRDFKLPFGLESSARFRFNRVEGLYGESGLRKSFGRFLEVHGNLGYSTALPGEPAWSYETGGTIRAGRNNRFGLDISYARYTDTQTRGTDFMHVLNGVITLLGGRDYYDYYRNERFHTDLSWRSRRFDSRLSLGIRLEDHSSLEKQTDYDLFGNTSMSRPNPVIEDGLLRSFTARVHIGDDDQTGGFLGKKSLELMIEHSDPTLMESDFAFTSYEAILDWRFQTFFKRRFLPNTLDVRLQAFTSAGDVPFQRLAAINGNMEIFSPFGTMKTRALGPYRGDKQIALFWEHNFRTFPFELLGMNGMAEKAFNIIVFGGHARSTFPERLKPEVVNLIDSNQFGERGWQHELGISLSGVFSVLRIDFARRLNGEGYYIGIGTARIF